MNAAIAVERKCAKTQAMADVIKSSLLIPMVMQCSRPGRACSTIPAVRPLRR